MGKIGKFLCFIIGYTVLIFVVTYYSEIKNYLSRENVYVLFDVEKDKYVGFDWSKYSHLFPDKFEPRIVRYGDGLELLSEAQRLKFYHVDSIREASRKYRIKVTRIENNKRKFIIPLSGSSRWEFEPISRRKEVKLSDINSLNVISLDSVLKIDLFHPSIKTNIIEVHSDRAFVMKSRRHWITY